LFLMKITILLLCLCLLLTTSLFGQSFYTADVSVSGTNTTNLFKNSSDSSDTYVSTKATLNLFALSFAKVNLFSEYTKYNKTSNLSNLNYGFGVTCIPFNDSSKFSAYMNVNVKGYNYKDTLTTLSSDFSDKEIKATMSIGYLINEKTRIRTGLNSNLTGFASDSVANKQPLELFTGINFSLFGANAIDIEAGYTKQKYDFLPIYRPLLTFNLPYAIRPADNAYTMLKESDLNSYYLSLRLSRPLGQKTGLSLNYSFREFTKVKDSSTILGSSTGYLSPWTNSYSGNSIQAKIKTFLVPYSIVNIGAGYWNSSFLNTLETVNFVTVTSNAEFRYDDKYRVFLTISTPIVTSSGRLLEPSLSLDYTDNKSTNANYTYSDFTISLSFNVK